LRRAIASRLPAIGRHSSGDELLAVVIDDAVAVEHDQLARTGLLDGFGGELDHGATLARRGSAR
jgi:hypothetical protein